MDGKQAKVIEGPEGSHTTPSHVATGTFTKDAEHQSALNEMFKLLDGSIIRNGKVHIENIERLRKAIQQGGDANSAQVTRILSYFGESHWLWKIMIL